MTNAGSEIHSRVSDITLSATHFFFAFFRAIRFFSLIIRDSAVGRKSYLPVMNVWTIDSAFIALVSGSASITLVSIHLG